MLILSFELLTGGMHHAKKAEASGFCFVNDIVMAILELLKVSAGTVMQGGDLNQMMPRERFWTREQWDWFSLSEVVSLEESNS